MLSSEELAKDATTSRSHVTSRRKNFLCGPGSFSAGKVLCDGRWGNAGLRVQEFKCTGFANIVCCGTSHTTKASDCSLLGKAKPVLAGPSYHIGLRWNRGDGYRPQSRGQEGGVPLEETSLKRGRVATGSFMVTLRSPLGFPCCSMGKTTGPVAFPPICLSLGSLWLCLGLSWTSCVPVPS